MKYWDIALNVILSNLAIPLGGEYLLFVGLSSPNSHINSIIAIGIASQWIVLNLNYAFFYWGFELMKTKFNSNMSINHIDKTRYLIKRWGILILPLAAISPYNIIILSVLYGMVQINPHRAIFYNFAATIVNVLHIYYESTS